MDNYNPYSENLDEFVAAVDAEQLAIDAHERGQKFDHERYADAISTFLKVLSVRPHRLAFVSETDERGMRAFRKAGFEIIPINGNRTEVVTRFISQRSAALRTGRIRHIVLVTTDPTFTVLAEQADPKITRVSFWAPAASVHRDLTLPPYDFRDLDQMLPGLPKVAVLVDFENIWFGLKKLGWTPNVKALVDAIKKAAEELGEPKKITAYADWDLLGKDAQRNVQRELAQQDVDPQYLINIRGKNTADMRVANEIRDLIEKGIGSRDEVDTILLATGDRDFRDIVKTAIQRGKKVIIMAVRNGVSHDLKNVATDVRYIEDYLKLSMRTPEPSETGEPLVRPWYANAGFVIKILTHGKGERHDWLSIQELDTLGIPNLQETIQRNLRDGLITRESQPDADRPSIDGVRLNLNHPVVEVVSRVLKWVPDRISFCQKRQGMPYLDSGFIARGFTMDKVFQEWRIGQNRNEAEGWLDLLAQAGVIVKKIQPHPTSRDHNINTWWLAEVPNRNGSVASPWPISKPSDGQAGERKAEEQRSKDNRGSMWQLLGSPA